MIEIKRFILLIGYFCVTALFAETHDISNYQVVRLKECSIVIDKRFELIEKLSEYEYNFIAKIVKTVPDTNQTYTDMKFLSIHNAGKDLLQRVQKHGYKQIFDKKFLHYQVFKIEPDHLMDAMYVIFDGNMSINFTGLNNREAIKMIEYCEKTRKP